MYNSVWEWHNFLTCLGVVCSMQKYRHCSRFYCFFMKMCTSQNFNCSYITFQNAPMVALGGRNAGETARGVLRQLASNKVWSEFSLQGRGPRRRGAWSHWLLCLIWCWVCGVRPLYSKTHISRSRISRTPRFLDVQGGSRSPIASYIYAITDMSNHFANPLEIRLNGVQVLL